MVVFLLVLASAVALVASPAGASAFPSGFTDTLVAGGLGSATAVAQLPDGRFLVTSQSGQLWVVDNGAVSTALDLAALSKICTNSEEGLLGVTVDPQFSTNGRIYLYYTANGGGAATSTPPPAPRTACRASP